MEHILLPSQLKHYGSILTYFFKSVQILLRQNNIILESLASFAKSPIKRLAVHKVQPALALLPQLYKIRSNLLRILSKVGIIGRPLQTQPASA